MERRATNTGPTPHLRQDNSEGPPQVRAPVRTRRGFIETMCHNNVLSSSTGYCDSPLPLSVSSVTAAYFNSPVAKPLPCCNTWSCWCHRPVSAQLKQTPGRAEQVSSSHTGEVADAATELASLTADSTANGDTQQIDGGYHEKPSAPSQFSRRA
jgi:hypothetical protein